MPSREAHLATARRNQLTIEHLLKDDDTHLPWVVAVAFYKALHVIEAVIAADKDCPVNHTDDHKVRNKLLKTTSRYSHFWKMYRPLWEASLVARYLQETPGSNPEAVFSQYMPRKVVEGMVLKHHLHQIEKSAATYLGENFLAETQA